MNCIHVAVFTKVLNTFLIFVFNIFCQVFLKVFKKIVCIKIIQQITKLQSIKNISYTYLNIEIKINVILFSNLCSG